ncbi:MAG: hypothetical protein JW804_09350 [Sedimentisphaerales bacterium]|nr:hypothetical protein [Sedimentisphaerales bacterium]
MKKFVFFITALILIYNSGCGFIGTMGSPTRDERKIPAEYNLASKEKKKEKEKILVVAEAAAWSNIPFDLKDKITCAINQSLVEKLKLDKKLIINFKNEMDYLEGLDKSSEKIAFDTGKKAGADLVLYIEIYNFDSTKITETSYHQARLSGRAALFDIKNEQKVWPVTEQGKLIDVGFDIEQGGYSDVTTRLAGAFAHCTVRYLYNCPVAKFKNFDDRSMSQLEQWEDMF